MLMKWISPWINTTDRCNCSCSYCYIKQYPQDMNQNIYERINRYTLDNLSNGNIGYCKYRLAGGEPMIVIDKWYNFAEEYLTNVGDKGGIEVLTNLTIYPELLDPILDNDNYININISLDSVNYSKPYHNGKSSSVDVIKNIKEYIYRHKKPVFIMSVITDNGIHLPELAEYVVSIGAKWEIQANKNYEAEFNPDIVNSNIDKVLKIFSNNKYSVKNILYNFADLGVERKCENGHGLFGIMSNGDITNCQMQNDVLCSVHDEYLDILANNTTGKRITDNSCVSCPIHKYCHGDCPYKSNDSKRRAYICKTMLHYIPRAIDIYVNQ